MTSLVHSGAFGRNPNYSYELSDPNCFQKIVKAVKEIARVSYNGNTSDSKPDDVGSIPTARANFR